MKKYFLFDKPVHGMSLLFAGIIFLSSCTPHERYITCDGMVWNTLFHITYESPVDFSDSIYSIFNEIDGSLSPFNETSVVSKINRNESDTTDRHFSAVYLKSQEINSKTEGNFDPTLAPLIRAWGFGQGHEVSSDTLRLDSLLQFVGITKTSLQDNSLEKSDPRIEFNFSALAKGYGVDCIAEMFENNGVENYLIEVGGEIRTAGLNPEGRQWRIGIDSPSFEAAPGEIVLNLYVGNCGIATSGNYRNFHESSGKKFGHTISPKSGRPVETDVISATVIAPTCMEADALATSCMVMGSKKGMDLCNDLKVGVMLILKDMKVISNDAFKSYLDPLD